MKTPLLLTAATAAALTLSACNKQTHAVANDTGNSDLSSMNPGQTAPVNAAQDAMGAAVGATSATIMGPRDTGAFVDNAGQSNMYEVDAAKIAQEKSKNAEVTAFAKKMVSDHTAMMTQMKPLIAAAQKTPPTDLDQRRKGFLDNLRAAGPADFDKVYIDQQVAAHEETLTLLKGYADNGDDAGLKAAAAKAIPEVQAHLDRAKAIQAKLGAAAH